MKNGDFLVSYIPQMYMHLSHAVCFQTGMKNVLYLSYCSISTTSYIQLFGLSHKFSLAF